MGGYASGIFKASRYSLLTRNGKPANQLQMNTSDGKNDLVNILMIEDDVIYRALCKRYLAKDPNYTYNVVSTTSAAGALRMCNLHKFDCLIIDYNLPDSTGTQLISALRATLGEDMPPAIVLTAEGGIDAATEAVRTDASDFLSKNKVSARSLCRSVNNAVEKGFLKTAVSESSKKLTVAYEQLQQNSVEIENFYHTISHEVKTPLTAIQEFLSLINDEVAGPITEQQKELLGYSLESCTQISTHFNDLLDMARVESGKLKLNKVWDSPNRLLERSVRGVEGVAASRGITLKTLPCESTTELYIDVNRIVQVISNLLNNAIKHSEDNGSIEIELGITQGNQFEFNITDFGCGIEKSDQSKIFDRLYQVDSQRDCAFSGGLGLGLSIARDIMHLHDGQLLVDSEIGKGSTFKILLPVQLH